MWLIKSSRPPFEARKIKPMERGDTWILYKLDLDPHNLQENKVIKVNILFFVKKDRYVIFFSLI